VEASLEGKVKSDRMGRQSVGGIKSSCLLEYKAMAEVQMIEVNRPKMGQSLGIAMYRE
jgi:hypothetical protein